MKPVTHDVSSKTMLSFLQKNHVAVLSTLRPDGSPDGVSIYYLCEYTFSLLFPTKKGLQKYINIQKDNRVCVTVTDADNQITMKIRGTAEDVGNDIERVKNLFDYLAIVLPENQSPPFLKHTAGESTIMKVTPIEVLYKKYDTKKLEEGFLSFDKKDAKKA